MLGCLNRDLRAALALPSGCRIKITTGKYIGQRGKLKASVYQKIVDYPSEWSNGYNVMLDSEELVTVRWDQVEASNSDP